MGTQTNHDLEKSRIQREVKARLNERRARRAGADIETLPHLNEIRNEVIAREHQRRAAPVYDPATLKLGRDLIVLGACAFVLALVAIGALVTVRDTPSWAVLLAGVIGLVGGWAALAGIVIRSEENLPYSLTPADIQRFATLLENVDERHRPRPATLARQLGFLLLTAESFAFLGTLLPLVADGWTPNALMAAIIPLSLALGLFQARLVASLARAVGILRIRKKHAALAAQTLFPSSQRKAAMIREYFGHVVLHNWDPPRARDYRALTFWAFLAFAAIGMLSSARLFASAQGSLDLTVAVILGVVTSILFVMAVATEVHFAVLLPELEMARRTLARFPTAESLKTWKASLHSGYDAELALYFRALRLGYESAHGSVSPGVPKAPTLDFSPPSAEMEERRPAPHMQATAARPDHLHPIATKGAKP